MSEENYETEITLRELKGHYETHFLTSDQFIDLVKEWHNGLVKNLTIPVVSHRYFKCSRCGAMTKTQFDSVDMVCTSHQPARINGICGGSFCIEITEHEFNGG